MKKDTENNKIKMLEALEETKGIVTHASRKVGITPQTFYNWVREDAEFKEAVEFVQESAIDFVEGKLFQKINGLTMGKEVDGKTIVYEKEPSDTAIIFYLKTKAKHRGYVERLETTGKDGKDLYSNMSDEELDEAIENAKKTLD